MRDRLRPLLLLLAFALGCTDVEAPSGQCRYDSDCEEGQVCTGTYCRPSCRVDRDCPTGQRCGETDRAGVNTCLPMVVNAQCTRASDCPAGLSCIDGACRPQCQRDYDCQVINPFFTCTSGVCALTCSSGAGDCDGDPRNGCEVSLGSDAAHCGTCTTACAFAHAAAVCAAGACALGTCATGFGNCDGTASNGCEATLDTSAHCGACGRACGAGTACAAGACVSTCPTGTTFCAGSCVNTATSAANCGACGRTCPAPANGAASCAASACGFTCDPGFTASGEGCARIGIPRPVAPASLTTFNGNTDLPFEVTLPPGADGATIELCRDRACTMSVERFSGTGSRIVRRGALPAGLYFWRAYARVGMNTGLSPSAQTWEVVVPARAVVATAAWGTFADFNGDGYADLAVGEPGGDRAFIYHGGADGIPGEPTRTIDDDTILGGFGNAVTAGDFNGDGFADLAVASDSSTFYVYAGSATGLAATPTTRTGSAGYGRTISAASDLNHDGYADLAVAFSCFGSCRSGADIYLGGATGLGMTRVTTLMATDDFMAFNSIAAVGRLSASSPYESLVMLGVGKGSYDALVFRGTATGVETTAAQSFSLPSQTRSLSFAYDVNGDGFGDVVTGAQTFGTPSTLSLYLGTATGLSTTASQTIADADHLGGPVAGLGDVNGDGYADVLGGDSYSDVRLYFGGASPALTAGPVISVPAPPTGTRYPNFGRALPFVGDFNRDNLFDVIVGAPPDYDGDCGTDFFVYPGRTSTTAPFTPARVFTVTDGECARGGSA